MEGFGINIPAPLTILLVEDDASSRMLFAHYLKHTPHRLVQAENGARALECFRAEGCDLVFLDLHLPGVDGRAVLERMRAWEREQGRDPAPVYLMSAVSACEGEDLARGSECSGFMPKPYHKGDILALIGRHWGFDPMES
jgi:CheY-like chemotaxis protein